MCTASSCALTPARRFSLRCTRARWRIRRPWASHSFCVLTTQTLPRLISCGRCFLSFCPSLVAARIPRPIRSTVCRSQVRCASLLRVHHHPTAVPARPRAWLTVSATVTNGTSRGMPSLRAPRRGLRDTSTFCSLARSLAVSFLFQRLLCLSAICLVHSGLPVRGPAVASGARSARPIIFARHGLPG